MIDPEWFFSTLAQAAAASIGFVIAFSAALHTSRRARQQERVNNFKQEIRNFRDKVEDPMDEMRDQLRGHGQFDREHEVYRAEGEPHEKEIRVREWSNNQPTPVIASIYKNLEWIQWLLIGLDGATDPAEMDEMFQELERPIINILVSFDTEIPKQEKEHSIYDFYQEIRGDYVEYPSEYSDDFPVFSNMRYLTEFIQDHTPEDEKGSTLRGWVAAMEAISNNYYSIDARRYFDTSLFTQDQVGSVLGRCKTLFIYGVIVPIIFLITLPSNSFVPTLPTLGITTVQLAILGVVGYYGWKLFEDLIILIQLDEF